MRQEIWLASTTEHVIWSIGAELSCAHLNREWQFHAKCRELTGAFLACPPDWARGPPPLHNEHGLPAWLPDNCTGLADSLQQIVDASKFPTLVGKFTQQPSCTIPLWQIEIFISELHLPVQFLTILFNCYWYLGLNSFQRKSRCIK